MRSIKKDKKLVGKCDGFTLIELIIYVALSSILLVTVITFGLNTIYSGEKSEIRQETLQGSTLAMQRILEEIRSADDLNDGTSTFGSSPGVLSLASSTSADDPVVIDVDSNMLQLTLGAGSAIDLLDESLEVTNLVFTDLSRSNYTKHIRVELTVRHENYDESNLAAAEVGLTGSALIRTQSD